ncbi:hypothetical protein GCM10020000_58540 [Streptomyces olivoverticillatus]
MFTRRLGRRLSAQDLGLDACAPVYAGLEFAASPEEAIDIVSGLWRKDSGSHTELRKIAFTPAGLVVPSRDWLIGRADERVARGAAPAPSGEGARLPLQARGSAPRQRLAERAPGSRVTMGDIAALRSVGELFRTIDHAYGGAGTPGRRSCATWSTRPSRCCAARTGRRPGGGCSPRPPTSPGSPGGPRTTSPRTASPSATTSRRCGSHRPPGTGRTAAMCWSPW